MRLLKVLVQVFPVAFIVWNCAPQVQEYLCGIHQIQVNTIDHPNTFTIVLEVQPQTLPLLTNMDLIQVVVVAI